MKKPYRNLLYVFLILMSAYINSLHSAELNIKEARKLYKNGNLAQATIAYSNLKHDRKLSSKERSDATRSFNTCIRLLQSDPAQTDAFGALISLQKNNQQIMSLLHKYSYLLETQRRYNKLIEVQKQIYSLSPTTSQKYNLARKLELSRAYDDAYELYHELLSDRKYNKIVLRRALEILKHTKESKKKLNLLLKKYSKQIFENYDLTIALLNTFIDFNRPEDALNTSLMMVSRYPQSSEMVIHKIISLYNNGRLSDSFIEKIDQIAKQSKNKLSDEQRYLLAKVFVGSNNLDRALDMIGNVQSKKMLKYKANLFLSAEKLSLAKSIYLSLLEKYPPEQEWYRKIAEISFRTGEDQQGIEYIDKYVSESNSFNDYFYAGRILERYGFLAQAEKIYLEGKKRGGNKSLAIKELTKYYISRKNFQLAANEIYNSQIHSIVNPKNLYASIKRTFANQYEVEQLIQALHKLVKSKPKTDISKPQLANLYYCLHIFADQISDIDNSTDFFIKYIQNTPYKEKEILAFSKRLETNGFLRQSYKLLSYIPKESSLYPQTVKQRVRNLINQNKNKEALKILKQNPKIKDNNLLSLALYKNGQTVEALRIISKMRKLTPSTHLLRADIALINKNFDKALTSYSKITQYSPLYATAQLRSGLTNLFINNLDKALSSFEKISDQKQSNKQTIRALWYRKIMALIKKSPEDTKKWSTAEYLIHIRDTDSAINLYSEIIATDPKELYVPYFRMRVCNLMMENNRTEDALRQLDKIKDDFPESSLSPKSMSLAIDIRNNHKDEQHYVEILEKYPNSYDADRIRAIIEQKNSNHKKNGDQL